MNLPLETPMRLGRSTTASGTVNMSLMNVTT